MTEFPTTAITREDLIIAGNNDVLDLAADIDSVQGNLTVGTNQGSRLVVGQTFVIDQEAFHVTAIVGDVVSLDRGYDNTTPTSHTAGSGKIVDRPIAAHHNVPADELYALLGFMTSGFTRDVNAGGKRITNLQSASQGTDAANLNDVQAAIITSGGPGRFTNLFLAMGG